MNGRAFLAIIRRSLDRRFAGSWLLGFGCAIALALLASAHVSHTGWLIVLLISGAPSGPFGRRDDLQSRVSLFAMPLFGRELARALAVEPCLASLAIPLGIILGLRGGGHAFSVEAAITMLIAILTATLIGLSASLRTRENAVLYIALAIAAEAAIVAPLLYRPLHPLLLTLPLALLLAFAALRAFGETLARYDPVPA